MLPTGCKASISLKPRRSQTAGRKEQLLKGWHRLVQSNMLAYTTTRGSRGILSMSGRYTEVRLRLRRLRSLRSPAATRGCGIRTSIGPFFLYFHSAAVNDELVMNAKLIDDEHGTSILSVVLVLYRIPQRLATITLKVLNCGRRFWLFPVVSKQTPHPSIRKLDAQGA